MNRRGCCLVLSLAWLVTAASAQTEKMVLEREREIEIALSAAPEHLQKDAGVYVLQKGGYVQARASKNGFNCAVLQGSNVLGPICYDAEGSATNMKADFRRRELYEQGKSAAEVKAIIEAEYKAGKLLAPRKSGVAYMLSPEFKQYDPKTSKGTPFFPPHVMFYAPYLKNSDIGAPKEHFNSHSHVFVLDEGTPGAYLIVVPKSDSSHTAHATAKDEPAEKKKMTAALTPPVRPEDHVFGLEYLRETQQQLLNAVAGLSETQMNFQASPERWSIAQIVEHLVNAENAVFTLVTQRIVKTPVVPELAALLHARVMKSPVPTSGAGTRGLLVKDQTVILTTTNRTTRRFQAPEPVVPRGRLTAKADLLQAFVQARGRTLNYLETTSDDLRGHLAEHWVLGVLDAYQWLLFVMAHNERHIAQVNEVKAHPSFPKQ